jgi:hypothetical protein
MIYNSADLNVVISELNFSDEPFKIIKIEKGEIPEEGSIVINVKTLSRMNNPELPDFAKFVIKMTNPISEL